MNLLILGNGGREHALAWKIAQSPHVENLYIAPGNAGTARIGRNIALSATDFPALKEFAIGHDIDMVVVGPEDPLVKGVYDYFKNDDKLKDEVQKSPLDESQMLFDSLMQKFFS